MMLLRKRPATAGITGPKGLCVLLSLLLLAACAPAGAPQAPEMPMGRYVEEEIAPRESRDFDMPVLLAPHPDGTVDYIELEIPEGDLENERVLRHYRSPDAGQTWETVETPWLRELNERCGWDEEVWPLSMDMHDGVLYCFMNDAAHHPRLFLVAADGSVTERQIQKWNKTTEASIEKIRVTESGQIGVTYRLPKAGTALYDGQTGKPLLQNYGVSAVDSTFADDTIYGINERKLEIRWVDGGGRELELPHAYELVLDARGDELYVLTREGVNRLGKNKSVFETMMKGSYYQYSAPDCIVDQFRYEPATDCFYLSAAFGDGSRKLFRYSFDRTIPLLPEKQLSIFSLRGSDTVQRAILEFQRQRPEVAVQYINGWSHSVTEAEATAMMISGMEQGQGPDVLLLDDLDAEQLLNGELLLPLSPPEGCFDNILASFRFGDDLLALPARFDASLPCSADVNGQPWEGVFTGCERYDGMALVPGENEFRPLVNVAVSAGCREPEIARAFVNTMFSQEVQRNDYREGFPVLKAAFEEYAREWLRPVLDSSVNDRVNHTFSEITLEPGLAERCAALTKIAAAPPAAETEGGGGGENPAD